jgi:membrane protein implicated in regulation of membrane protease activity
MQLAILLVLILIAVILAPWLLGVIAIVVAAYGLWLVAAFALTIAAGIVILVVYSLRHGLFQKRDMSSRMGQKIAEANRLHRVKEAAQRSVAAQEELKYQEILDRAKKASTATCKSCSASIEKYSMYCPKCGKSPI